jgi:hypothetical protein
MNTPPSQPPQISEECKVWLAIAAGVDFETTYDAKTGKMRFTTAPCSVTLRNGIPHVQMPNMSIARK